jgi:hypothetical protein
MASDPEGGRFFLSQKNGVKRKTEKRGQTLRDPHKFILSSAFDGTPHHAEPAPIFPSVLSPQNLCSFAWKKAQIYLIFREIEK